ncbi:hypothetical protein JW905_18475 [bacterium]|nr:hypothetical protein [candidate division CSSED10-310 bacterium]
MPEKKISPREDALYTGAEFFNIIDGNRLIEHGIGVKENKIEFVSVGGDAFMAAAVGDE